MNAIVFALHCLIVLGVPVIFGWVLLRRVFREANWLALVPGAAVTGFVALMAMVNELRFFYEMRIAVWSAYKLLLALALIIIVAQPRGTGRLRLPGCVNRSWKLLLAVAGTICVGFYYGVPAFHGYLNDAWWYHYPAAVQIQNIERFPLPHVFALDDPLYYHPGPDILAACWSFLLELPVQTAWAFTVTSLAPCAFLLAFALMARLTRNYWAALLGATFLMAGGNLRFLLFLTGRFTGSIGALRVFNSQTVQGLLQLVFTPSHLLGVPLVLLILLLFRHFSARPSWRLGAVLGLVLGTLTLVAEWYFLPLVAGFVLVMGYGAWRGRTPDRARNARRFSLAVLPAVVAIFWGAFNNTYLAGTFGHFWMHYASMEETAAGRQIMTEFNHPHDGTDAVRQILAEYGPVRQTSTAPSSIVDNRTVYKPSWTAPDLVPLRFNFSHFGRVPSWESAASNEGTFISIFSAPFLMESAPVLLVGIPFGLWLACRRRTPLILLLAWLAVASAVPPIFLDWGFRSADFLRFFTASYCYAALFLGWCVGELLARPALGSRMLGGVLAAGALISPLGLGIVGLLPGTIDTVKAVASSAQSLSQVSSPKPSGQANDAAARHLAFEKLAVTVGDFLFPLTKGRDRVIVVVPVDQIPEVKYFPEWMKMATLSRIVLPVGWHWQNSLYSAYYRDAVTRLDARAITALDAKWVIISTLFEQELPPEVAQALLDGERFVPAARFHDGKYSMTVFKVRP